MFKVLKNINRVISEKNEFKNVNCSYVISKYCKPTFVLNQFCIAVCDSSLETTPAQRSNSYRKAVEISSRNPGFSSDLKKVFHPGNSNSNAGTTVKKQPVSTLETFVSVNPPKNSKEKSDSFSKQGAGGAGEAGGVTSSQMLDKSSDIFHGPTATTSSVMLKQPQKKSTKNGKDGYKSLNRATVWHNKWNIPLNKDKKASSLYDSRNTFEVSEVPELKADVPSRQSSFLRRVQGKSK